MRKYILKRLFQILLTLYIYATIVFIIIAAQPGSLTRAYIDSPQLDPAKRDALKAQLGLDKPIYLQYVHFIGNIATGNLGISTNNYPRPVWDIIKERLPRTAALFLVATLLYFGLGFYLGKLIAWRRGGILDYSATITGVTLWTVYTPWLGLLLIWIFAFKLKWLPLGKFLNPLIWRNYDISANTVFSYMMIIGVAAMLLLSAVYLISRKVHMPKPTRLLLNLGAVALTGGVIGHLLTSTLVGYLATDILWHMILPVFALALVGFGGNMLLTRDSMVEVVKEDYIMAAKAKGLPDRVVRDKHAARNALLPMVTSFVLALAFALNGSIVIEQIFSWPGIGLTLLNAVGVGDQGKDLPLAIGAFVFTGIFALIAHLVADILYAYLDPRIRYE